MGPRYALDFGNWVISISYSCEGQSVSVETTAWMFEKLFDTAIV